VSERLDLFVKEALGRGIGRDAIRRALAAARWPHDEVAAALDAFAESDFPLPVPRPKAYVSAKDAFGYLVLFSTLYTSAVALIRLLYQYINRAFPDPVEVYVVWENSAETIRWSAAALFIAFPLFMVLSRRTYRATREDPEMRTSKVRKWLTYLTLFVAAATLLCDGITLVYYLLGGELTTRFLFKALTICVVAGGVFGYYLWDLRQGEAKAEALARPHRGVRVLAAAVILAVGAALAGSFVALGTVGAARDRRIDDIRLQHLALIAVNIDNYWSHQRALPPDLQTLAGDRTNAPRDINDPESGALYEYTPGEGRSYELCATFDGEERQPPVYGGERFWGHPQGRHCFEIEVQSYEVEGQ
jgi:Domain of unknown function (DUF5671)